MNQDNYITCYQCSIGQEHKCGQSGWGIFCELYESLTGEKYKSDFMWDEAKTCINFTKKISNVSK